MIPYAEEYKHNANAVDGIDYNEEKKVKWHHEFLLNRPSKVVTALVIFAILAPILLYQFIFASSLDLAPSDGYSQGSCVLPRTSRIPCGKGNIPEEECHPQCCYDLNGNMCYHRLPSRFSYIMDREWTEDLDLLPRVATEPFQFQQSYTNIRLSIDEVTRSHMSITFFQSSDTNQKNVSRLDEKDYNYIISPPELNVEVVAFDRVIFNTRRGPLVAADNIWETSFQLTNESMYGFGEIPLKETSKIIYYNKENSGSLPLIFARANGSYHGLLIDITTPTEVSIHGDNEILVRSITKNELKFHLFIGPEPKDVMEDVMKLIGYKNQLEYWMLGGHVCSESKNTYDEAYKELNDFVASAKQEGLPYESHCGAVPFIFNKDCDDDVSDYLQIIEDGATLLVNENKRVIPHLSPYIRYIDNETLEEISTKTVDSCNLENYHHILLLNNRSSDIYTGIVSDYKVVYPYYNDPTAKEIVNGLWKYNIDIHGLILENAWPLDESFTWTNETYMYLPYFNEHFEAAFNGTPPWNVTLPDGTKYFYTHNEYGNHFFKIMKEFSGDIPIWTSGQRMNGRAIINKEKMDASWTNFRRELIEIALGGVSGQWLWSSPICGDTAKYDPETQTNLCLKWYMASTYFPMIKIHSNTVQRHPLAFSGTTKRYMLNALNNRQSFLPYFYTVLQKGPLLRPMFYQFPRSDGIQDLISQFSVGDDILIVPDLLPSQSHVNVWMPPGTWYELWSGMRLLADEGEPVTLASTEADFLTLVRGGSIVPLQKDVKSTAEETRKTSDYSLTIALECHQDGTNGDKANCTAQGRLYITENITINFLSDSEKLTITAEGDAFEDVCGDQAVSSSKVKDLSVFGLVGDLNNYDHHRYVAVGLDVCELENSSEIVFIFV